jgi:hypothetical protein
MGGHLLEQAVAEIAGGGEHDGDGEPDPVQVHVECVELDLPANEEVVYDRKHEQDSDTICGSKVRMERHEEREQGTHSTRTCTPT